MKTVLQRFAYRLVWFDTAMAKSFYKLPEKEIKQTANELENDGAFAFAECGYMLRSDIQLLETYTPEPMSFVCALHRNDFLYKANEHVLKSWIKSLTDTLPYDHEPLQYLLINGEFQGASIGHFRNGPYDERCNM